jgi:hypothetical protein
MRDDLEIHGKSLLTMENFIPTLQGTAVRAPGTRYLWEFTDTTDSALLDGRIIPYLTPNNQYSIVEIVPKIGSTDGELRIRQNIAEAIGGLPLEGPLDPDNPNIVFKNIVRNSRFYDGLDGWTAIDEKYTGSDGAELGIWQEGPGQIALVSRDWKNANENDTCTLKTTATIPEDTDQIQVQPIFTYANNFSDVTQSKITGSVSIGTTEGATDIWTYDFSDMNVGERYDLISPVLGAFTAGTVIYLTFTFTAVKQDGIPSTPFFRLRQFRVASKVTVDVDTATGITYNAPVDYTAAELVDVHFVQSPYFNSGNPQGDFGNELVLVHPKHPPRRLYYTIAGYIFEDIPFDTYFAPPEWAAASSYPATCTSYMGRLVLAGSDVDPTPGSLAGSLVERVWMTEVGKWYTFTDPTSTEVNPDDSIEFSSTYRSPIQWVHGQSNLLIGSESYEYVSNADGIYSPGDLGVFLQSTHGSEKVQPVPMGQYVLFAAEQGSRVRAMQYVAESEYWISPDTTIYHPTLFPDGGGIKRMVRLRNPHQICVCLMNNGVLALLHQDSYANISGWSKLWVNAVIHDICVQPKDDGTDVLYALVRRVNDSGNAMYLEAIADWTYGEEDNWGYTAGSVTFFPAAPTNVITGLDHLEGKFVQVVSQGNYLGTHKVVSGQVTLLDGTGAAINVDNAEVGVATTARIRTMPLVTQAPGSKKRWSDLYVRVRNSGRPLINGVRPADRDSQRVMDEAQDLDIISDLQTEQYGWNRTQVIEVRETLPVKTEVVGIFGKVKGNET